MSIKPFSMKELAVAKNLFKINFSIFGSNLSLLLSAKLGKFIEKKSVKKSV